MGNCLSVTHNGSPVDYVGIAITTIDATAESYLKIPAGESVEGQIALARTMRLEPGDTRRHSIAYRGAFRLRRCGTAVLPHRLKLTIITSDNAASE